MKELMKYFIASLIIIGCLNIIGDQRVYFMSDQLKVADSAVASQPEKIKLNAGNIEPFLFGFAPLVADLLWIYTIAEMDMKLSTTKQYNLYYTLAHLFTDLDPRFEALAIYGSTQLVFGRQGTNQYLDAIADSQEILLKSWDFYLNRTEDWEHYSKYWMIPQIIGFNYYFEYKDRAKALPYYEYIANHVPYAPSLYRTFAAEIYKQLNRKDDNLAFLENILMRETLIEQLSLNRDNKEIKEKIRRKIIHLKGGAISQETVDKAIKKAREKSTRIIEIWQTQYAYLEIDDFVSLHADIYNEQLSSDLNMVDVFFDDTKEAL